MNSADKIYHLAIPGVQQLIPYKPGKPIEELEREFGLTRVIKLASNENPLGPGKKALAAIQSILKDMALYPDGSGFGLKHALAVKYAVESDQITLGNGSNEILELAARAFLTPGLEVIFSQHAFAVYPIVTQAVGATAVVVTAVKYGHDLEAMLESVTEKTRIVFIANPNNPTGTLLSQTALESFISALPESCVCVLDEAYFEFVSSAEPIDSIDWLKTYPNLIITRTFSKAYGLAGLRVGYGLSSPQIADILNRVRQPFNNNALALAAAEAALTDSEHLQQTIATNARGMEQLTDGFKNLGLEWIPSAGNFVLVDLKRLAQPVYEALLRKGVIVRPVANYGLPNHLRISIGTHEENRLFLKALTDSLQDV
ncbi:Histidinol-phosphate aminotransferase 2 [Candidatus Methylobacter favarea]|uniref:Histidinol-phosphate aminotransferase n=1 Tax=Candidatus Methylobacter favarea TaxID=2707345 RepID=A0A8S0WIL5_9GAMM|nr:histidinol-phosphate transaminase [Candidatus Methylobacter favarea]CAA9890604.1 Histidinol-phosphate aminotransferase 2 [Candidatus Methylobacter favarea]